jgi:hypothetical protein
MATKAQRFLARQQRSGPKQPEQKLLRTKGRRRDGGPTNAHNFHGGDNAKATYAYEPSATRPSRKSTRISDAHVKTATGLRIRQIDRVHSPKTRSGH